jgi:ribosomal protein S18 acetylase RimI-like enzyme
MALPLCVRIDAADEWSATALAEDGWRCIETLETWRQIEKRRRWPMLKQFPVREAQPSDMAWISRLAAESFAHDRLHKDPLVDKAEADAHKVRWVNEAETIWVPCKEPAAFLIMDGARIALIAVRKKFRSCRYASRLIRAVMHLTMPEGQLIAGTQSTNEPARRLYASLHMTVIRSQTTWHK